MRQEELNDRASALQTLKKKRDAFESAMRLIEEADSDVVSALRSAWLGSQGENEDTTTAMPSNGTGGGTEEDSYAPTLMDAVLRAVERSPNQMTARTIFDDLVEHGYEARAKRPKASIASYLRQMVGVGKLRIMRRGRGSRNLTVYEKVGEVKK